MKKKNRLFTWAGACGLGFAALSAILLTPEETREQKIKSQFSVINGEHLELTKLIKKELLLPSTYYNLKTTASDVDSGIIVNQAFAYENDFGEKKNGFAKAFVSNLGEITILEKR